MAETPVPTPEEMEQYARAAIYALRHRLRHFIVDTVVTGGLVLLLSTLAIALTEGYTFGASFSWAVIITAAYVIGRVEGYRFGSRAVTILPPK